MTAFPRSGNDILVGNHGDDTFGGQAGNDVLFGGQKSDSVSGGDGEDLLVEGTTTFDDNLTALRAILAEWTSTADYETFRLSRPSASSGGLNSGNYLQVGTTVLIDSNTDTLSGDGERDWIASKGSTDSMPTSPGEAVGSNRAPTGSLANTPVVA
ncbi:MAG: hypothetical protein U1D30_06995 [Planctomycetota bacterium]